MAIPDYENAIKEEIGTIYITGGGFVDRPFKGWGTDSRYGWQEMVWYSTPTRARDFSFSNLDEINVGLIARCELNVKYMNIQDYMDLRKILGRERHFMVRFFDTDEGDWVTRDMYCSENTISKLFNLKQSLIGVLDYTIKLVGTNLDLETVYKDNIDSEGKIGFNIRYFTNDGEEIKSLSKTGVGWGKSVEIAENPSMKKNTYKWVTKDKSSYIPTQKITVWGDLELYVNVPTADRIFENNSWEKISKVSQYIAEEKLTEQEVESRFGWKVGDKKAITLSPSINSPNLVGGLNMVIYGFNHDNATTGSKAGISLVCENTASFESFSSPSNIQTFMNSIFSVLPEDLRKYIKEVYKNEINTSSKTISTYKESLWMLGVSEIYSEDAIKNSKNPSIKNDSNILIQEGSQYSYYNKLIGDEDPYGSISNLKRDNEYLLRTIQQYAPYGSFSLYCINTSGKLSTKTISNVYSWVTFGFCV